MARIPGVPSRDAGPYTNLMYFLLRRGLAAATGHTSDNSIEPLQVYARVPGLLRAYGGLERATGRLHRVPERLRMLAELKAATLTSCAYCIDLGSQIARRSGLSVELTHVIALENLRGRFNVAFGIGAPGFNKSMVCAMPLKAAGR